MFIDIENDDELEMFSKWVMSFTGGAKVLNPPELKKRVADAAREILKNS